MEWALVFKIANTIALCGWLVLALLPHNPRIIAGLKYGVVLGLAITYSAIVLTQVGTIEGGFDSLENVKKLFSYDVAVLAGWIHYLAFDLFIGIWIAQRLDGLRVYRLIQFPILFFTFMFGPMGLILCYAVIGWNQCRFLFPTGINQHDQTIDPTS